MSRLPIHERRGLNRQEAISYLGVEGSYFDKSIRPQLKSMKLGTSQIFDRLDLDIIFDQLKVAAGDVGPTEKGVTPWPKEPQVSLKQKTDGGVSISSTKDLDFKAVLKRIKQQKSGC